MCVIHYPLKNNDPKATHSGGSGGMSNYQLIVGDARNLPLEDESVDCIVTSPPYWGLRDYKQEGQIGLEPTIQGYLKEMEKCLKEMYRVLKKTGTLWLNIGDTY